MTDIEQLRSLLPEIRKSSGDEELDTANRIYKETVNKLKKIAPFGSTIIVVAGYTCNKYLKEIFEKEGFDVRDCYEPISDSKFPINVPAYLISYNP